MTAKFKEGDCVKLVSSDQKLTVQEVSQTSPYYYYCIWYDEKESEFKNVELKEIVLRHCSDFDGPMPISTG